MKEREKLKVLYDANTLTHFYDKSSSRSGIYFAAFNFLKEFALRDDLDLTLYASYDRILFLRDFIKAHPDIKNLKMISNVTFFNSILARLSYWKYKNRKIQGKDNIIKKIIRFVTIRAVKITSKIEVIDKSLKKKVENYDVYFSPQYAPPSLFRKSDKIKRFIFLHDVIPIVLKEYFSEMRISTSWFHELFNSLNKNDFYFTNSEFTKKEFVKYCHNITEEHVKSTLLGANEDFRPVTDVEQIKKVKAKYNIPDGKKYIFSLCTLEPRKNLVFALRNFVKFIKKNTIDDFIFVLGGGHWELFLPTIQKELEQMGDFQNKIVKTGYIDDEDLAVLYSGSEMFIYPSHYEGFGMPVLEAMQCGCPVITSNTSSLPEVIGEAGIQIDPNSDEDLITALEKMYFDENFRNECRVNSLEKAKEFSWKKSTDIIIETIKQKFGEN